MKINQILNRFQQINAAILLFAPLTWSWWGHSFARGHLQKAHYLATSRRQSWYPIFRTREIYSQNLWKTPRRDGPCTLSKGLPSLCRFCCERVWLAVRFFDSFLLIQSEKEFFFCLCSYRFIEHKTRWFIAIFFVRFLDFSILKVKYRTSPYARL